MGAVQILTHSMVQSIEENSVRKGFDPRDFALVAEGGAGPLFAAQIALEVGTPWVLVPPYPGSHRGDGPAGDRHGLRVRLDGLPAALEARRGRARAALRGARGAGPRPARGGRHARRPRSSIQRVADCRYLGQGYELRVDAPSGAIDDALGREDASRLPRHPRAGVLAPLRRLRHRDPQHPRARHRPDAASSRRPRSSRAASRPTAALRHEGEAWFRVDGELEQVATRYYDRRRAEGRQPPRGPGDRQPVRLDDGHPAGDRGAASTASATSSSRSARRPRRRRSPRGRATAGEQRDVRRSSTRSAGSRGRRRASASRSTRSRCGCSAARSTRSPRRWPACSSG